jgi:hypothetical protein
MVFVELTSTRYGDSLGIADEVLQAAERVNRIEIEDGILKVAV